MRAPLRHAPCLLQPTPLLLAQELALGRMTSVCLSRCALDVLLWPPASFLTAVRCAGEQEAMWLLPADALQSLAEAQGLPNVRTRRVQVCLALDSLFLRRAGKTAFFV